MVTTIATAVEEQSIGTREIAVNAGQASQGIREVVSLHNQGRGEAASGKLDDFNEVRAKLFESLDALYRVYKKLCFMW